jgi:hypothetical protein
MKRLLAVLFSLALTAPASAQIGGLMFPGPGGGHSSGGGIAFNTSVHNNFTSNTTFNMPGITAPANSVNIIEVGWNTVGNTISLTGVSDSVGAYTQIGSAGGIGLFYAVRSSAQSGNVITFTTSAATTLSSNVGVFTGLNTAAPVDTSGTYSGTVSGPTPAPSWSTSATNTVLIGAIGPNNGQFTVSGGTWNVLVTTSDFGGLVYEIVGSSGPQTPPTYSGDGGIFASVTSAFK